MATPVTNMQDELFSTAVANATSANIKAGFDLLAVALEGLEQPLQNNVMVRLSGRPGDVFVEETKDPKVPVKWDENCASRAAVQGVIRAGMPELVDKFGLQFVTETNIPNPAGMGSSGASAAAGMKAGLALVKRYIPGFDLSTGEQIEAAVAGETARHYDNVSAAVLGGLAEKRSLYHNPLVPQSHDEFVKHNVPGWYVLLAKPEGVTKGSTAQGRSILTEDVKERYEKDARISDTRKRIIWRLEDGNLRGLAAKLAEFEDPVECARAENGFYGRGITPKFLGGLYRQFDGKHMAAWMSGAGPYMLVVVGEDRGRAELAKRIFFQAYAPLGYKPQFIEARLSNQGARSV
ncbi:MAG: hypothetical protein HY516_05015 [Candidatus Aenigmarchaeota archaeon]|nr:hypothetical protein [Candidatus Aenigmarchaeota archaeon]